MRRILSIALAVLMLLSVATVGVFTVSAETGSEVDENATAINDATDFALMNGSGSYYLAADITVDTTYNKAFTGTFDGRGHKITTTAPLFAQVSEATIKNVVIEGTFSDTSTTADYVGMLAKVAENSVIENVVSNVTMTATASNIAGIIGYVRGGIDTFIVVKNCVNNGTVTTAGYAAGIVAACDSDKATLVGCVNNAEVKSVKDDGVTCKTTAAGVLAVFACDDGNLEMTDCVNNANVTGHRPGGVLGCAEQIRSVTLDSCVNNGDVLSNTNYAGGIACRIDPKEPAAYRNCVNTGTVTILQSQGGGIIGYSGESNGSQGRHNFYACVNFGTITGINPETSEKTINCGGICGNVVGKAEFYSCVNYGKVISNCAAGGIVSVVGVGAGNLTGRGGSSVSNCYSAGEVFSYGTKQYNTRSVAGLVAYCWGDLHATNNIVTANVTSLCTTERALTAMTVVSGICGYTNNGGGRYENNYILGTITGTEQTPAVEIANFKTHNWDTKNYHLVLGNYSVNGLPRIFSEGSGLSMYTLPKPDMTELDTNAKLAAKLNALVGTEVFTVVAEGEEEYILPISVAVKAEEKEAVAVGTAAEFLAMEANGNYYLTADITLESSYVGAFMGAFDGKGYTITVSDPAFELLIDATVTNVVLAGEIVKENTTLAATRTLADYAGALASISIRSDISKVVNNADVTAFVATGAIVGRAQGGTFTECVNNGEIKGNTNLGGIVGQNVDLDLTIVGCVNNGKLDRYNFNNGNTGGIIGRSDFADVTIDACVNNANIDMPYASHRVGGIMGFSYSTYANQRGSESDTNEAYLCGYLTITNCVNNANVTGYDQVAGILAWGQCAVEIENCVNYGDITTVQNYAGGIAARVDSNNGQPGNIPSVFTNCVNYGDVQAHRQYIGGILAYSQGNVTFTGCSNFGEVTAQDPGFGDTCTVKGCHSSANYHFFRAGGILGSCDYDGKFYNCFNAGSVTGNQKVGGIAGEVDTDFAKGYDGKIVFENCLNVGDVYNYNANVTSVAMAKANGTGGIVGNLFSDPEVAANTVTFRNCGSAGTVTAELFKTANVTEIPSVAGLGGYVDTTAVTVEGCYFVGALVCGVEMANTTGTVYAKGSTYTATAFKNNAFLNSMTVSYRDAKGPSVLAIDYAGYVSVADVASGRLCYLLNEMIGSTVYYQQIGVDAVPTPVEGNEEWVVYYDAATNTYSNAEVDDETTTEEVTTGEVTTEEVTTEEVTTEEVTTEEVTTEEVTTEEVTTEEVTTEEVTTEEVTTEEVTTEEVTTAAPEGDTTGEEEGGCGSVIGASAIVVALALVAPAAIMLKKKED